MPKVDPVAYMARLRALAAKRGGTVLSKRYLGDLPKLKFRCAAAHVFAASPGDIKQGHWCSRCSIESRAARKRALGLARLVASVRRRGGTMDPAEYVTSQVKMSFRCAQGHAWQAVPNSIVQNKWCPICADSKRSETRRATVAKRIAERIRRQGGALLPPGFVGYKTGLQVRCRERHQFEISSASLESGVWCPVCREEAQLDRLRAAAARWGGELRSKSFVRTVDRFEWRCAQGHDFSKCGEAVLRGGWCKECRGTVERGVRDLQRIARVRGGECLSLETPARHQKARWRCQFGHEWSSSPSDVVQGNWCPECGKFGSYDRRRLSIAVMRQMAIDRGGRCLSKRYTNNEDRLRWECAQGHRWTARVGNVRQGSWCPKCAHRVRGSIESLRAMATERGGRCLSRHWDNHAKPVEFACAKGHRFQLNGPAIRTGVWCPTCAPGARSRRSKR